MSKSSTKEGQLTVGGASLIFFEAGAGEVVVILASAPSDASWLDSLAAGEAVVSTGAPRSRRFGTLAVALSAERRVISLSPGTRTGPKDLVAGLRGLGIERANLIAFGSEAALAMAVARTAPDFVEKLVLISALNGAEEDLDDVHVSTLIMVGTRDPSHVAERARRLRSRIPDSNLSIVYAAGGDLVSDRPTACIDTIGDFLRRGGAYVIMRDSLAIDP